MHILADSVGCAVPRSDFEAVVHSVFESAVNLRQSGSQELLTVFSAGEGHLPQGIRIDASASPFAGLQVGDQATCRDGILSFEGASLLIDFRKATRWTSDLCGVYMDVRNPATIAAWRCAWQALNEQQLLRGADIVASELVDETTRHRPLWVAEIARSVQKMLAATAQFDYEAFTSLPFLIGMGPGLTPSGDDLLVGFLIGLCCSARGKEERLRFLAELGKAVVGLSSRTTDISRTYLFHAAHGRASSQIVELAVALCGPASDLVVLKTTRAAMRLGHTSGMDAVTGLLLGLAAWIDRKEPLWSAGVRANIQPQLAMT